MPAPLPAEPADLYNCRTRETVTLRSVRIARETAMLAMRADRSQVDWILMSCDGDLYRSRVVKKHCGRAGVLMALTWDAFPVSKMKEKMEVTKP